MFAAMKKAIAQMQKGVQNKDEKMFLLGLDMCGCDSDVLEFAETAQRMHHKLR